VKRAPAFLLLATLAPAAGARSSGLGEATTLGELTRKAATIALASPAGSLSEGRALVFVEESWRGAPAGTFLEIGGLPPLAPGPHGLWLLYLAEGSRGLLPLGGERGAIPIDPFSDVHLVDHARGLLVLADLPGEDLFQHLAGGLESPSSRVGEDAAADLLRLPAGYARRIDGAFLAAAIEREQGPTSMRSSLLRLLGARGLAGDAPVVLREATSGPAEMLPLVGGIAREVPGATEGLAASLEGGAEETRLRIVRALAAAGDATATWALGRVVLSDSSPVVRIEALSALARPGGPVDGSILFHALATGNPGERTLAARAILLRGSPADLEALRALAGSVAEVGGVLREPGRAFIRTVRTRQ